MSDADREDVSVSADGITVEKTLNAEESSSATIVLKIRSARSTTVRLQLRETLPDGFTEGTVGFHPDYGDEYWSIAGETVVFERSFAPDEEFTTVYGLREIEKSAREQLESEPVIEIVDADADEEETSANASQPDASQDSEEIPASDEPQELEDIVSEDNSEPVQQVIAGERDTLPGLSRAGRDTDEAGEAAADAGNGTEDDPLGEDSSGDIGEPREPGQDPESDDEIDRSHPGADTETAFGSADGDDTTEQTDSDETDSQTTMTETADKTTETAAASDSGPTDIASALAEQLRAGNISEADREVLREELATDNSTEARVQHLQSEVSELAAYTEALEEFIDEEGTAQQVLDDLGTEIDRFEERLSDVEERIGDDLDDLGGEIGRLDDSLTAVEERLDGHDERLDSHEKRVEMAEGHIGDVETIQSGIESDMEDIRDSVDEMEEFRERLTDTLSRLTGGVEPESSDDE